MIRLRDRPVRSGHDSDRDDDGSREPFDDAGADRRTIVEAPARGTPEE